MLDGYRCELLEGYLGSEANWCGTRWRGRRGRGQGREGALHTLAGTRVLGFFVEVEVISTWLLAVVTFGSMVVTLGGLVLTVEVTLVASVTMGAMVSSSVVEASVVISLVSGSSLESTASSSSVGSS